MHDIIVRVCGDIWVNQEEVSAAIASTSALNYVVLDLQSEGASLAALGIQSAVIEYCQQHHRSIDSVHITNWPNAVEVTPFKRTSTPRLSHFFWMCKSYWQTQPLEAEHHHRFGFFVGRRTVGRSVMMYDVCRHHRLQFLVSAMHCRLPLHHRDLYQLGVEKLNDWMQVDQQADFINWYNNWPIPSLDDRFIVDQYTGLYNTNLDLVHHYGKFDIELVAETYTVGNTFFPTEKTVRPIMACRPMLVYGPINFLARLRELGFETYHTVWSEDYDLLEGPLRWAAMRDVIDGLLNQSQQEWQKTWNTVYEIAVRNRQHLSELIIKYQPL